MTKNCTRKRLLLQETHAIEEKIEKTSFDTHSCLSFKKKPKPVSEFL